MTSKEVYRELYDTIPVGIGREGSYGWRGYGVSATDWLAINNPGTAKRNNDNYNCFVFPQCGGP